MSAGRSDIPLIRVRLVGLPVDVYQRASEHNDELLREFALIQGDRTDHVPARLVRLVEELRARFGAFTRGPTAEIQEASARGDAAIDLHYEVPAEAAEAAARLGTLLAEADEFCRSGDLLTLAAPPEAVAFRTWFLGEFVRQIDGLSPRPWATVRERAAGG